MAAILVGELASVLVLAEHHRACSSRFETVSAGTRHAVALEQPETGPVVPFGDPTAHAIVRYMRMRPMSGL